MALIIRLDVDRPYGKSGLFRHVLSRIGTDLYFPRLRAFGYLAELKAILGLLNQQGIRACVFFRRCTFPSGEILDLMREGRHETGLHLENSRTMQAFQRERKRLERHMKNLAGVFSKHRSGRRP